MSDVDHKLLDRQLFEELWSKGDLDRVDHFYAPAFVCHSPPQPDIRGREGIREQIRRTHKAYADLQYVVEDQIREGDRTLTRWTMRGRLRKPLRGAEAEAEGQQVTITGLTLVRYADGQIQEEWTYWDQLGLQQQLS